MTKRGREKERDGRDLFPIIVAAGLARQPVNKLFSALADYSLKNYKQRGVGGCINPIAFFMDCRLVLPSPRRGYSRRPKPAGRDEARRYQLNYATFVKRRTSRDYFQMYGGRAAEEEEAGA